MSSRIFLLMTFIALCFGLHEVDLNFTLGYYKYRNVRFLCILTCQGDQLWRHKLIKLAFQENIASSMIKLEDKYHSTDIDKIESCLNEKYSSVGALIDFNCPGIEQVLYYASEKMFFNSMRKWLLINERNYREYNDTAKTASINNTNTKTLDVELETVLNNLNISVDADIVIAENNGYLGYYLYDVYNVGKVQGGNLIINKIGLWRPKTGLQLNAKLNDYKYYRRWDFQQWQMRMITVVSPVPEKLDPKMLIARDTTPGVPFISKTSNTVLHEIAQNHNFRFVYTLTDRWIRDFTKNSSKVVATSIYFQQHDITPILRISTMLIDHIDIVQPALTSIETRYYYRIPTSGPGKFENQFLRPLCTGTWSCIAGVITLCAAVLLISARLEQRPMSGQYAMFSVLASLCQQYFDDSCDRQTRSSSARKLTILVTGLCCVLIYNYYTSSVVSWLLNGPPPSINDLEELIESPLDLIYEDIGYTRSWLQYYYNSRNAKIEDKIKQKVFNKKKNAALLITPEQGIDMVKAGGFAYHTEVNTANMWISRKFAQSELCELGSLQSMEVSHLYPAVQKNSPYKEFWNWSLLRVKERGIVSCIQLRISAIQVFCEGSSPRALSLGGAAPAFILLAFGYLLATFIMLMERLFKKFKVSYKLRRINFNKNQK